jgi:hypothetical protein
MTRALAIGMALLVCACSTGGATAVNRRPSPLDASGAEQRMVRADDIRRGALEGLGTAGLAEAFRGRALQVLEAQARGFERRGLRLQEHDSSRSLAFWDPRAEEAVLQVVAQRRLVTPDQPSPAWASTVRQWWARLEHAGGQWWVVDQDDLTPDRWRAVPPTG